MSKTVTQTQVRTAETMAALSDKRAQFIRTASIEKLRKFNNFVCSQHYLLVPGLLLWLRNSQTLLKSHMEKYMAYFKTMLLVCIIREFLQQNIVRATGSLKQTMATVKSRAGNKVDGSLMNIENYYEIFKQLMLYLSVYLSVLVIFFHTAGCVVFIILNIPPLGFFFLLGCILGMARIGLAIMVSYCEKAESVKTEDSAKLMDCNRIRRKLVFIGKTISNVKLF